jgi:hypothetical protein
MNQPHRETAFFIVVAPAKVVVVVVEVAAPCMRRIALRGAPPVSEVTWGTEGAVVAATTARKGRKTASVIRCQVAADSSCCCICTPIRLCRQRFGYLISRRCSKIVAICDKVIFKLHPFGIRRNEPTGRSKLVSVNGIPVVEYAVFLILPESIVLL